MRLVAVLPMLQMVLVLAVVGCTRLRMAAPHAGEGVLQAGAAKVDITPLAGMPLGAHSIEGGFGLARWTRLSARAIYLEDAQGGPLVLVSCDLWAIPAGLGDAVLLRLHDHHGVDWLDRTDILLAATHTHHGPAAFASKRLYNRAAGPTMGFDPELHEFLVDRIALAIATAAQSREPASVRIEQRDVGALARNRSLEPFLANPEADGLLASNAELPACKAEDPRACRAIDPTLTTLHIADQDGLPIAVAAFFAVHATSMLNRTDAYNGDLFGIASAHAERTLADSQRGPPVVAVFNGAEADVSPDWSAQGPAQARELGERLGAAIVANASGCGPAVDGRIDNHWTRVDLSNAEVEGNEHARTAKHALPGKAIFGGAEDGPTRYRKRWPEGQTVERHRRAGQGPKRPAIPPALFTLAFPSWTLVDVAPVSLHRFGAIAFVGVPGEFSTVMGQRIASRVRAGDSSTPSIPSIPIIIGLADEYAGYFVTPHEYALQHYEGASTLWGQYSASLLADRIAGLATHEPHEPHANDDKWTYPRDRVMAPGQHRRFALRSRTRALRRLEAGLLELFEFAGPTFTFRSAPPTWAGPTWPSISLEVHTDGRWIELWTDEGSGFLVFPLDVEPDHWTWRVGVVEAPPVEQQLRYRIVTADGEELCSAGFGAGDRGEVAVAACASETKPPTSEPAVPPGLMIR